MDNFGVIELASTKTTNAPGWAYVPDRQGHHLAAAGASTSSTSNRTRGRNAGAGGAATSSADLSARRDAKARREIEILDEDNPRGVQIAIPPKPSGGGGGGGSSSSSSSRTAAAAAAAGKKHTPNVRRILQSQKTFANHLDDYMALLAQQDANPNTTAIPSSATTAPTNIPGASEPTATRRGGQRQAATSKKPSTAAAAAAAARREAPADQDVEMHDAPPHSSSAAAPPPPRSAILTAYDAAPARLEGDDDPLLASRLPPLPSDGELRALLAAPPLGYLEARGAWPPQGGGGGGGGRYPVRVFCAICGYWGRERCLKCGTRVCALDCLEIHREECVTRYGL
ncbi:putative hit finger domain-containing protein [Rosellinia necatrix]|uniref:Putative hit finger domain-containing protein n=1 Tax=Rosellinia necatrix TaxID=77044 RepID=A0A1S7UJX4_ROSNE|nr:putative hit finger domain-containing protein [Rosellinia necatrix]